MSSISSIPSSSAEYYAAYNSYQKRPNVELVPGKMTEIFIAKAPEKDPNPDSPSNKILEQHIERMDGVEFVVPEGFNSFEEYLADWSAKFGPKLRDPWESPPPEYRFYGWWSGGNMMGDYWLDDSEDLQEYYGSFMDNAFAFFRLPGDSETYWNSWRTYQDQIYDASLEYMEQIAAGKGTGLENLTKKVTLQGVDMTLNDLVKTHRIFNEAIRKIGAYEGTPFENAAKLGLSTATVKALAKKEFSAEMAGKIVALYENRVQLYLYDQQRMSGGPPDVPPASSPQNHYYSEMNAELDDPNSFIADTYRRFSNVDVEGNYSNSFQKEADWYLAKMRDYFVSFYGYSGSRLADSMNRIENTLIQIGNAFN